MSATSFANLAPFYAGTTMVNVVVETSKGSPVKLTYDFGFTFPFCFGFVPHTIAGDGDPIDVLILNDYAMSPGTVVVGQILSVLEASQTEKGKPSQRNDRLIVAPWDKVAKSPMLPEVSFDRTPKHAINDVLYQIQRSPR